MYSSFIATAIIGVICILLGISNRKGNIDSLHSYHRKRVSEEDRLPFGKLVGLGTIIAGASVIINSALTAIGVYFENDIYVFAGTAVLIVGLIVGLGISFYAMIKYNKGIF